MAVGLATAIRNNILQQLINAIDAGAGAGTLKIYNGTRPATGGTATTLLGTLTLSDPCAAAPSGGLLTFSAITADSSADATSTATWARIADSTGAFVMDLSVGAVGSGADIELTDVDIVAGGTITVVAATITAPAP